MNSICTHPFKLLFWSLAIVVFSTSSGLAYDFSSIDGQNTQSEPALKDLSNKKIQLWSGTGKQIEGFETGVINQKLLWIFSTTNTLYFQVSKKPNLKTVSVKKSIPGQIFAFDLYPMSTTPSSALLTVNYHTGNGLSTLLFALDLKNKDLNLSKIESKTGVVLRPLSRSLYGQRFSRSSFWSSSIYRYRTTSSGYTQANEIPLAGPARRVLSLTPLQAEKWTYISAAGNVHVSSDKTVRNSISGNYGATKKTLSSERSMSRRPEKSERVRLAPAYLPQKNIIGVANNPVSASGLGKLFFGGNSESSSIELFKRSQDTLTEVGIIGPHRGRINDMEVPESNNQQLLWLRTVNSNKFFLEMIDFSEL